MIPLNQNVSLRYYVTKRTFGHLQDRMYMQFASAVFCCVHIRKGSELIFFHIFSNVSWLPNKVNASWYFDSTFRLVVVLFCEHVEWKIKGTQSLTDHTGLNVSAIFRVRCTVFKELPSGLLLRKVWNLETNRATKIARSVHFDPLYTPTIRHSGFYVIGFISIEIMMTTRVYRTPKMGLFNQYRSTFIKAQHLYHIWGIFIFGKRALYWYCIRWWY